jgi:hypothetical protein
MDDQGAIKAPSNVQFNPVGSDNAGLQKGFDRIFSNVLVQATVRENLSHRQSLSGSQA